MSAQLRCGTLAQLMTSACIHALCHYCGALQHDHQVLPIMTAIHWERLAENLLGMAPRP